MIIFARKNAISICLLTLLSHSSISAKDCNAKDYDLSPEIHDLYPNIADGTFEEQHPSAAALAQVGFSHPFMCSALSCARRTNSTSPTIAAELCR